MFKKYGVSNVRGIIGSLFLFMGLFTSGGVIVNANGAHPENAIGGLVFGIWMLWPVFKFWLNKGKEKR